MITPLVASCQRVSGSSFRLLCMSPFPDKSSRSGSHSSRIRRVGEERICTPLSLIKTDPHEGPSPRSDRSRDATPPYAAVRCSAEPIHTEGGLSVPRGPIIRTIKQEVLTQAPLGRDNMVKRTSLQETFHPHDNSHPDGRTHGAASVVRAKATRRAATTMRLVQQIRLATARHH